EERMAFCMNDPRIRQLAELLIGYSVELKPGEKLLIECMGLELPLARELIRQAYAAGGEPYLTIKDHTLLAALLEGASEEQLDRVSRYEAARMAEMDAYIAIRAGRNAAEL